MKWADTEKERQARRAQKAMSLASNVPNADSRQHLFGALPMGYVPPYNGYGYQVCYFEYQKKILNSKYDFDSLHFFLIYPLLVTCRLRGLMVSCIIVCHQ